jgi:arsenate reductase
MACDSLRAMREPRSGRAYDVLFLCTGNSARSLLAERLLEDRSLGRFRGHSAGSRPTGCPHPIAIAVLAERGHDTKTCRSKSWDEFALPGGADLDFVITLCDDAMGESCPSWPGRPANAHWGMVDPASCRGEDDQVREAFVQAYDTLWRRIQLLMAVPVAQLGERELEERLQAIGLADDS